MTDCSHRHVESDGYCPLCEMLQDHAQEAHSCACVCELVRGTEKYEEPTRSYYLDIAAHNSMAEALQMLAGIGKDILTVESDLLTWYVYGPVHDGEHYDTLDRADVLNAMRYDEYLRTPEWAEQRRRAVVRAGGRCQGCNDDRNLEVHHRLYGDRGAEDLRDLTVLCAACHTAVHLVVDGRRGKVRNQSRRARV